LKGKRCKSSTKTVTLDGLGLELGLARGTENLFIALRNNVQSKWHIAVKVSVLPLQHILYRKCI